MEETVTINFTQNGVKPDTSESQLKELEQVLKLLGNKKVLNMHVVGNGSKYLHVYTAEPALTIRISDHPSGNEKAINVKSKWMMIAEAVKIYLKIK